MSITVGRDRSCDIILDNPRISRVHAKISIVNGSYTYEDMSSNGSVINGNIVKSRSVIVNPGDTILLAASDALPWSKVQQHLPLNVGFSSRSSQPNTASTPQPSTSSFSNGAGFSSSSSTPSIIDNWSWGGFIFGAFWAVCNGIYWPLIVLIPGFGFIAAIVVAFVLGAKGNRMAWEDSAWQWRSVEKFELVQKRWRTAAFRATSQSRWATCQIWRV